MEWLPNQIQDILQILILVYRTNRKGDGVKLSIITIHLNDFIGLQRTLRSLERMLGNPQIEWILIDGGSDATKDTGRVLSETRSLATRFISEPDEGIYDAMNKGTVLADGELVLYLNAGDELHPEFEIEKLASDPIDDEAGMLWGRYDVRDKSGTVYSRKTRSPVWLRYGTAVCHQAVLFRRKLLGTSPYRTDLQIAADYDLICRLYTAGEKIHKLEMAVCIFELVGTSGTNKRLTLNEEARVRRKYFPFTGVFNLLITNFKLLMWNFGTFVPSFRRAWARYF